MFIIDIVVDEMYWTIHYKTFVLTFNTRHGDISLILYVRLFTKLPISVFKELNIIKTSTWCQVMW